MKSAWLIASLCVLVSSVAFAEPEDFPSRPAAPIKRPEKAAPPPAPSDSSKGAPVAAPQARGDWSIVLATYRGEGKEQAAGEALKNIREQGNINDARLEARGTNGVALAVVAGRFSEPTSSEAQERLAAIRAIVVNGKKPYLLAFLAPPNELNILGAQPEYNLLKAKEQFGDKAKYTLQVGAYGRTDGKEPTEADLAETRKAAEEAVARLRKEGELAFYYHSLTGRKLSMVCIGVWNDGDIARRSDPSSMDNPELKALCARFPNNLVNGAICVEKTHVGKEQIEKPQRSTLVLIPSP